MLIDRGFRKLRQRRIGVFFFVKRLFKQPNGVVQTEFLGPSPKRTVP